MGQVSRVGGGGRALGSRQGSLSGMAAVKNHPWDTDVADDGAVPPLASAAAVAAIAVDVAQAGEWVSAMMSQRCKLTPLPVTLQSVTALSCTGATSGPGLDLGLGPAREQMAREAAAAAATRKATRRDPGRSHPTMESKKMKRRGRGETSRTSRKRAVKGRSKARGRSVAKLAPPPPRLVRVKSSPRRHPCSSKPPHCLSPGSCLAAASLTPCSPHTAWQQQQQRRRPLQLPAKPGRRGSEQAS